MKRILISVMTIALVSVVAFGITRAFFTDTETSTGNTFTTGTIDIAVDGTNPWTRTNPYQLIDMKPSQTDYIDFTVHNVGSNPVNLYKTLTGFVTSDVVKTEPEREAENNVEINNVDDQINYDMKVELYDVDPGVYPNAEPVWWENIYTDGMAHDIKLGTLENQSMYLGMIPEGKWMKVYQSYHMVSGAGNEYQGDQLAFNIVLTGEQLGVHALRLENKVEVDGQSYTMWWDTTHADLTYKVKDREFSYELSVNDMADGNYDLIAWEGYPSFTWGGGPTVMVLANVTVSESDPSVSGSVELNQDLTNAKVWLVPGTTTPGTTRILPWPLGNALFETGLIDYYDSDL